MTVDEERYTRVAIALHWAIAALIIANILIGIDFPSPLPGEKYSPKPLLKLHISIGMLVLVLSIARAGWRLVHHAPPYPEAMPRWERAAASATHRIFYLLMIAMPASGWLILSSHKNTAPLRGVFNEPWPRVPWLAQLSEARLDQLHDMWVTVHIVVSEYLAVAMLILHLGAVAKHHLFDRDPVLRRMLPWRSGKTG